MGGAGPDVGTDVVPVGVVPVGTLPVGVVAGVVPGGTVPVGALVGPGAVVVGPGAIVFVFPVCARSTMDALAFADATVAVVERGTDALACRALNSSHGIALP